MNRSLGGSLLIRNGNLYDYCYKEAIQCLLELCDKVVICVVPTSDGTYETVLDIASMHKNIKIRAFNDSDWHHLSFMNKHRLSMFTNYAIEFLDTDYVFNLQSDEIVDSKSYSWIRKAVEEGAEGYLCTRINLWASPYKQLNVPHNRKPCSTEILRLAKTCYRAYDDAESVAAPCSQKYLNEIKIWHMGFVRKREIHPAKIRNMQGEIFHVGVDPKLEGMEIFDPYQWFSKDDLIPIEGPLPPLIQEWAAQRTYED